MRVPADNDLYVYSFAILARSLGSVRLFPYSFLPISFAIMTVFTAPRYPVAKLEYAYPELLVHFRIVADSDLFDYAGRARPLPYGRSAGMSAVILMRAAPEALCVAIAVPA